MSIILCGSQAIERARSIPRSRSRCAAERSAEAPWAPSTWSHTPRASHRRPIVSRSSNEPVAVEPAVATTAMTFRPRAGCRSSSASSASTSIRKPREGTATALSVPRPSSPTARATA